MQYRKHTSVLIGWYDSNRLIRFWPVWYDSIRLVRFWPVWYGLEPAHVIPYVLSSEKFVQFLMTGNQLKNRSLKISFYLFIRMYHIQPLYSNCYPKAMFIQEVTFSKISRRFGSSSVVLKRFFNNVYLFQKYCITYLDLSASCVSHYSSYKQIHFGHVSVYNFSRIIPLTKHFTVKSLPTIIHVSVKVVCSHLKSYIEF